MSDQDIIIPGGGGSLQPPPDADEFTELLETLIKRAQSERRYFLAYLLRMALIEARNHAPEKNLLAALAALAPARFNFPSRG